MKSKRFQKFLISFLVALSVILNGAFIDFHSAENTKGSHTNLTYIAYAKGSSKQKKDYTVYITRTGEKYHRSGCRYLSRSKIKTTKQMAVRNGYSPCKVCRP